MSLQTMTLPTPGSFGSLGAITGNTGGAYTAGFQTPTMGGPEDPITGAPPAGATANGNPTAPSGAPSAQATNSLLHTE
jgi:hypothetical protein